MEQLEDRTLPSVTIAPTNNSGQGYAGLDYNHSQGYSPPDTQGAAGPSSYVETVNQAITIFSPKATGTTQVTDSLSHFFSSVGALPAANSQSYWSDPVVVYDDNMPGQTSSTGRFIVEDQNVDSDDYNGAGSLHQSVLDIAVSRTATPQTLTASDWIFYQINTTENDGTPNGAWDADYPGNLGYNKDAVFTTLNMLPAGNQDTQVQLISLSAADLANGVSQSQLHAYKSNVNAVSLRPAVEHDAAAGGPEWLAAETVIGSQIAMYKMTNVLSSSPTLTSTSLTVNPYSQPVTPLNPNGTSLTDNSFSSDSKIQKMAEANNTLVATQSVAASSTQDVIRWYSIDVSSGTPAIKDQGNVSAGNNTYLTYPSIDINSSGQIGMTYLRSGTDSSTDYLSMYVTGRSPTDPAGTMETPVLVPKGTGQANESAYNRVGDLSGINVDPIDGSFWATNEYANTETPSNWGTAIANFTISTSGTALPPGWSDTDIGNPGKAGSASYNGGTWTVSGGGSDIYYSPDMFNFASQSLTGDGLALAKITSMTDTSAWAKAGVMFRNDTTASAMFIDVVATPGVGVAMQWRPTTSGSSHNVNVSVPAPSPSSPVWVKLVRSGNSFSGYYSLDGSTWTQIGSAVTVNMAATVQAGLAVTAHNNSQLATATFTNVAVTDNFSDTDIGSPAKAGSASLNAFTNTWTVTGGGSDIYYSRDMFNFASKSFTGDGTIYAAVTSMTDTNAWAKAGVMFRNDTTASATFVDVVATPGVGVAMQWRASTGGSSSNAQVSGISAPSPSAPVWVKLVRSGNSFTGYYATTTTIPTSSQWIQIGRTVTVNMASTAQVGLAVTAHNNALLCTATFTNVDPHPLSETVGPLPEYPRDENLPQDRVPGQPLLTARAPAPAPLISSTASLPGDVPSTVAMAPFDAALMTSSVGAVWPPAQVLPTSATLGVAYFKARSSPWDTSFLGTSDLVNDGPVTMELAGRILRGRLEASDRNGRGTSNADVPSGDEATDIPLGIDG